MPLGLRLALMVLLAAAPIFLIEVIRELHLRDARRARVVARVETLADQIAARENRFIEAARFLLAGISRLDEVTGRRTAQCSHEMGQIAIHFPAINAIAVTDAAGHTFCGSDPQAAALSLGDRPYYQAALHSKRMQTSGYILGRASHRGSFVFAYPVLGKDGRVDVVIVLAFSTDVLARGLNNPPLPAGGFAALVDPKGKVVARWPDPAKWIGHDLSGAAWAKAALTGQKSVVSTTVDGNSGAFAVASAPMEAPAQLTVLAGRPLGPVLARLETQFWQEMGLISVVFLLAALAAWSGAVYGVQRPIRQLADQADAVSRGEFNQPERGARGIPELRALSERFRSMGQALATRERELRDALQQKDMLLKEVNHRVKNSLQLVASLFGLQRASIADRKVRALFEDATQRISTIARVHQRLYQDQHVDSVPFDKFLVDLCDDLRRALASDGAPGLECSVTECRLSTDKAIPLALVVNELVTNAFKYAYPDGRTGTIRVDCRTEGNAVVLVVADDGEALPADFNPANSQGLGMRVVDGLIRQLRGKLEVTAAHPGKMFVIRVPT